MTNKLLSEKTNKVYPFLLLTGRTRDQWHSGTKTGFIDSLSKYKKENFMEIHPSDAEELGIKDGDKVLIQSPRGELHSYAKVVDTILVKTIFIPITNREINFLTNDLLDPFSKEPDYNHSAVKVKKANSFYLKP